MKKKFDKEYRTEYPLEVCYLTECGINYAFKKCENYITVWKYTKTKELGVALSKFWEMENNRGDLNRKI